MTEADKWALCVTTGVSQERTRAQRGRTVSREARSFAQEERRKANR